MNRCEASLILCKHLDYNGALQRHHVVCLYMRRAGRLRSKEYLHSPFRILTQLHQFCSHVISRIAPGFHVFGDNSALLFEITESAFRFVKVHYPYHNLAEACLPILIFRVSHEMTGDRYLTVLLITSIKLVDDLKRTEGKEIGPEFLRYAGNVSAAVFGS